MTPWRRVPFAIFSAFFLHSVLEQPERSVLASSRYGISEMQVQNSTLDIERLTLKFLVAVSSETKASLDLNAMQ